MPVICHFRPKSTHKEGLKTGHNIVHLMLGKNNIYYNECVYSSRCQMEGQRFNWLWRTTKEVQVVCPMCVWDLGGFS